MISHDSFVRLFIPLEKHQDEWHRQEIFLKMMTQQRKKTECRRIDGDDTLANVYILLPEWYQVENSDSENLNTYKRIMHSKSCFDDDV